MISSYPRKFIFDVGVGRIIENWFNINNFVVFSIAAINPEMSATVILEFGTKENAIIITMYKDFGELVFKHRLLYAGVLLLKIRKCYKRPKISRYRNTDTRSNFKTKKQVLCLSKWKTKNKINERYIIDI